MCDYCEDEIIRNLELANDVDYIESMYDMYKEQQEDNDFIEQYIICEDMHKFLKSPISADVFESLYVPEYLRDGYDMYSKWCDGCSYLHKCKIRISERWHNGGKLKTKSKRKAK